MAWKAAELMAIIYWKYTIPLMNWPTDIRQNPRPVLLECMTFRMRGHEEASGTKYVPQHLFDEWKEKDPISNFEKYLLDEGVLTARIDTANQKRSLPR